MNTVDTIYLVSNDNNNIIDSLVPLVSVVIVGLLSLLVPYYQRVIERGREKRAIKPKLFASISQLFYAKASYVYYLNRHSITFRQLEIKWDVLAFAKIEKNQKEHIIRQEMSYSKSCDELSITTENYRKRVEELTAEIGAIVYEIHDHYNQKKFKKVRDALKPHLEEHQKFFIEPFFDYQQLNQLQIADIWVKPFNDKYHEAVKNLNRWRRELLDEIDSVIR